MRVPHCFLCRKFLFNRERHACEGGGVVFADFVPLEDLMVGEPPALLLGEPPGLENFCDEHLAAAQALSHLTSKEALLQLEQQFGKFEDPEDEPEPPRTRWQRLCDWWKWV